MTNTEALTRLRDLHEELSEINIDQGSGDNVDEETVEALGQLVTDLSLLVDQAKQSTKNFKVASEHESLLDRVVQFNSEHPRVCQFLNQMTDLLAMMGI